MDRPLGWPNLGLNLNHYFKFFLPLRQGDLLAVWAPPLIMGVAIERQPAVITGVMVGLRREHYRWFCKQIRPHEHLSIPTH